MPGSIRGSIKKAPTRKSTLRRTLSSQSPKTPKPQKTTEVQLKDKYRQLENIDFNNPELANTRFDRWANSLPSKSIGPYPIGEVKLLFIERYNNGKRTVLTEEGIRDAIKEKSDSVMVIDGGNPVYDMPNVVAPEYAAIMKGVGGTPPPPF